MPSTSGRPRYTKRLPAIGPRMVVDGKDLGPAILPQRLFVVLRKILKLPDDNDVLEIFAEAVDRLEDGDRTMLFGGLSDADYDTMIAQARDVSPSRFRAWREGHRHATWWEIYALLLGLLELRDEYVAIDPEG